MIAEGRSPTSSATLSSVSALPRRRNLICLPTTPQSWSGYSLLIIPENTPPAAVLRAFTWGLFHGRITGLSRSLHLLKQKAPFNDGPCNIVIGLGALFGEKRAAVERCFSIHYIALAAPGSGATPTPLLYMIFCSLSSNHAMLLSENF